MGGRQSQENSSGPAMTANPSREVDINHITATRHHPGPTMSASATTDSEDASSLSLLSSLFSNSVGRPEEPVRSRPMEERRVRHQEEEDDDEGESALLSFHTILARSLGGLEEDGSELHSGASQGERSGASSRSGRAQRERSHRTHHHHRHHHHHHHREGSTQARPIPGDGQRGMYVSTEDESDLLGLDLGVSWSTLTERLRSLQRREESEGRSSSSSSHDGARHRVRSRHNRTSAPLFLVRASDRKTRCPFCKKDVASSELEEHSMICMTKPRVKYNADNLLQDSGECSICLEDMFKGDAIARLPCLCVYHIGCLKKWYEKSQTCPEHSEYCQ